MINHINFGDEPSIRRPSPNIKDSFSLIKAFDNYAEYALSIPNFIGGEICLIRNENKLYYNGELDKNKTLLYYKTHDNQILEPCLKYGGFGEAQIIGNAYKNGQGVIAFDRIVTEIRGYVFNANFVRSDLDIYLPKSLKYIGYNAFSGDHNITVTIHYAGTQEEWNAIEKDNGWLGSNVALNIIYNS